MKTNNSGKPKPDYALLVPVLEGDVAKVRSLIAAGADLDACISLTGRGHMGAVAGTAGRTPLGIAIEQRHMESLLLDLSDHEGPDARQRENEARQKRAALLEIMDALAQAGADVNLFSTFRLAKCPLFVAADNNDVEAAELLLRHGARSKGTGALHYAALQGHIEMVNALLAAGMDANESLGGMTPLQLLRKRAESPQPEPEYVANLGPDYERQEAEREKFRVIRGEQIVKILEARTASLQ